MHTTRHVLVASAVLLVALTACRLAADLPSSEQPTPELPTWAAPWPTDPGDTALETMQARMAQSGFLYGENARWPEDIPADIPPLNGEVERVTVIQGVAYRISYSRVSKQALSEYLDDLEALGFKLQYIVYTAPSIPDEETQEKIARGEWDAVDITKGSYHMRLEPGDEGASLDIDNADFMTPGPPPPISPTPLVWPSDIPDRVPQPASCQMTSIAELGSMPGGYQIGFECTDPLVQEHFVETLLAAGLKETDRLVSDTGQAVLITLRDGEIGIEVGSVVGSHFVVTVWPIKP
jgi:hypothetical protein